MTGVVIATPTDADENAQVQQLAEAAASDFSARGDGQAVPVRRPRDGAGLDAMARGLAAAPANRQRGFHANGQCRARIAFAVRWRGA